MRRRSGGLGILFILFILLLLTGCWDRVEIDERGFVVGVGVDVVPKKVEDENEDAKPQPQRLKGTYQIIKPSGLASTDKGSGGIAYVNTTGEEQSMPTITSQIATTIGRAPYFEHLQLILISAELAREKNALTNILDYFLRDVEMRRDIKVMVAADKASDLLNVSPPIAKYPTDYLEAVSRNVESSSFMLPQTRIGDVHEYMLKKDGYAVQLARVKNKRISMEGAAIFSGDNNKLLGLLNGVETQGLNFLRDTIDGGIMKTTYDGGTINLELEMAKSSIRAVRLERNNMAFLFEIDVEGMLDSAPGMDDMLSEEAIIKMQDRFEQQIITNCNLTLKKLQQTYKQDVVGLGPWLRRNHFRLWQQVAQDWHDAEFPRADVQVTANVKLRRTGNIISITEGE